MFRCRRGDWRWRFVSEAAAEEAGDPTEMTGAEIVQECSDSRSTRCVFRRDGLYFKREIRLGSAFTVRAAAYLFPPAQAEFNSILLLKRVGIPVVEPVGCGSDGHASILITREEAGAVSVQKLLLRMEAAGELPSDEFLVGWSKVTGALFRKRIYFPDFHSGNLLCRGASGGFVIVDPQGIRRSFVDHENRRLKMIRRQYGECFGRLPKSTVLKMLAVMLPEEDPEELYRRLLIHSAAYIRAHSLRKRRRLEGFRRGKFTRVIDGVECRLDAAGGPLSREGTEALSPAPERAAQLWERDWLFSLFRLPTLRIVGRDGKNGTLYRERAGAGEVTEAERRDLLERVELAGFDPREFVCRRDRFGRARLEDLGSR